MAAYPTFNKVDEWIHQTETSTPSYNRTSRPYHDHNENDTQRPNDDEFSVTRTMYPGSSVSRVISHGAFAPGTALASRQPQTSCSSHSTKFSTFETDSAVSSPKVTTASAAALPDFTSAGPWTSGSDERAASQSRLRSKPDIRDDLDQWAKARYINPGWRRQVTFDPSPGWTDQQFETLWRRHWKDCINKIPTPNMPFQVYGVPEYYEYDLITCWVKLNMHYAFEESLGPPGISVPRFVLAQDEQL
ncbi:MAG: hypothetical protein LQ345_000866 [Seirophora villosa]|nr:MAG: hypothetical protein LQ345_000866 [Seirophora villosa]